MQKKVFEIMALKLPEGRLRSAAGVTPVPGEAPEASVSAEPGKRSARIRRYHHEM